MNGPARVTPTLLVLVVALILAPSGCGQAIQRVEVSGKVLLDGEPLTVGTIRFVPASGSSCQQPDHGGWVISDHSKVAHGW